MKQEFLSAPLRWLVFVLVAVGFFFVLYGADQGRRRMSNQVVDWLPAGFQETRDFNWFLKRFYEGELLMVSWDGCKTDDPRLEEIASRLTTPNESGRLPYYWKVMTTVSVYQSLTQPPLEFSQEEAYERMQGWIISHDYSQGCLIAFLSEEGYKDPHAAIDEIKAVVQEIARLDEAGVRIAGTSLDSVAIDDASNSSQQQLLPLFLAICIIFLFVLLKAWLAVFIVFAASIFNEEASAALFYYTGTNMDSISLLCTSLIFVLTISGGLHFLNYYHDNMKQYGKAGAVRKAIKIATVPCGLACLTTVLGLYSLTVSQVVPIRHFGIFSSIALTLGTIFYFVYIGAFVEQFPIRSWLSSRSRAREKNQDFDSDSDQDWEYIDFSKRKSRYSINNIWKWLPYFVIRHRWLISISNITIMIVLLCYLPKLETTITFHGMFPEDAPVIQNYNYLEDRIGGLIPLEVVVSIPKESNPDVRPLQSLGLLDQVERTLWEVDGIESSLSALTFVPYLPDPEDGGFRAAGARSLFNKMVEERLSSLQEGCLFDDRVIPEDAELGTPPAEHWRISLRVCAKSKIAYGPFLEKIKSVVNKTIEENQAQYKLTGVTSLITGGVPLVHKAQQQLLDDLVNSYISAFGMILVVLIILLRGILPGILAMIPNVFPSALVFGAMAVLGLPVDMGTMMTASVALGISVDGTIHFLTWYQRGLASGQRRREAVHYAYWKCGTAMVQASVICGGGMLIFALSRFLPISRFAWMTSLLLAISLYGDLVLFPSMLVGSLGRCFRRSPGWTSFLFWASIKRIFGEKRAESLKKWTYSSHRTSPKINRPAKPKTTNAPPASPHFKPTPSKPARKTFDSPSTSSTSDSESRFLDRQENEVVPKSKIENVSKNGNVSESKRDAGL